MEYRWRWVPNAKYSRWACTFHVVYANFVGVGHPTQTQFPVEYGLNVPLRNYLSTDHLFLTILAIIASMGVRTTEPGRSITAVKGIYSEICEIYSAFLSHLFHICVN